MSRYLVFFLLLAAATQAASGAQPDGRRVLAGLLNNGTVTDGNASSDAASDGSTSCDQVTFSRNLRYGDDDLNVLDVATGDSRDAMRHPVLLFVTGDSFAGGGTTGAAGAPPDKTVQDRSLQDKSLQEKAMCFAARNGMVAVSMTYRLAPAAIWPAGARDVAAAASWIHQNIDLFKGNAQEIVAIGYAAGAFHVASFLAHKEFQEGDSDVAGAVLLSGIYRSGTDAGDDERSYLGGDANKYDERSALPGILQVEMPIVLAWSERDTPRLIGQGEKLNELLCGKGHCPRTALLARQDSPASVFDLDGSGNSLAERTRQLIDQLEARGLP